MTTLHQIQKSLKVGKENRNEFGKYNYRNCADILEAVKPLLPDGFSIILSDDMVLIGDRYYIKSTATLTNGTESHSVTAFARESHDKKGMDDSQITGATSSYARKYALNGLFAIDDTTDADGMDNSGHETKRETKSRAQVKPSNLTISDEQFKALNKLLDETGSDKVAFCEHFGVQSVSALLDSQYDKAHGMLTAKLRNLTSAPI